MSIYTYEATNQDSEPVEGQITAASKEEALSLLTRKKLTPFKLEEKQEKRFGLRKPSGLFERFTALDRIVLTRNLAVTMRAGLSLLEALDILINDATKKITRDILTTAKMNVQNGQPLHKTFETFKKQFPPIFVGLIRAGEESGELDKTLDELSQHMAKENSLIKKVRSAMAYPVILLVSSIAIVILLLTFVLPKLIKTLSQSGMKLPLITRVLVASSQFLTGHWLINILVFTGLVVFFVYFKRTPAGHRFFSALVFRIPVASTLVKKVILVRVTRMLGTMISSALPIVEALELTAQAAGNHQYEQAILESAKEIRNGVPFSEIFRKHPSLFPKMLTSLIAVGEKTGTLENVLKAYADFSDEEVDGALKDLATFIEPVLLLIMGLVVGGIALAILLPIYQLVGKFV